jgi:A/G-specific adenine glycosylase
MPDNFARRLLDWFDVHGRHDLPWQHPRSPYRVWIAEIMLQQTQVASVIPYYLRFLQTFPDLPVLAAATEDEVLAHWSGLGYYSRARNLRAAARRCVEQHGGELPQALDAMADLPGIGRSTAAAILAQAHGQRRAILDGNVKRVLCRLYGIEGWPGAGAVERQLWPLAEALLPECRVAEYTQAIMDFGAGQCRRSRPDCSICPFATDCVALREGRVSRLPSPRPRKLLPQRTCTMVLLQDNEQRLLLWRRPPTGVWASLWSLPQFDDREGVERWADLTHADLDGAIAMPDIEHVFSHFRLRITPLQLRAQEPALRVADNDHSRWLSSGELNAIGLPAPVRRLLGSLPFAATLSGTCEPT